MNAIVVYHLDDDENDLNALKRALRRYSSSKILIRSFKTPASLLKKVEKGPLPNIVILDVNLKSKTNGIAVASTLRERMPYLTILIYSAYTDAETMKEARAAG